MKRFGAWLKENPGTLALAAGAACIIGSLIPVFHPGAYDTQVFLTTLTALAVIAYTYLTYAGLEEARLVDQRRESRESSAWSAMLMVQGVPLEAWLLAYSRTETITEPPPKEPLLKRALDRAPILPTLIVTDLADLAVDLDHLHSEYQEFLRDRSETRDGRVKTILEIAEAAAKTTAGLLLDLDKEMGDRTLLTATEREDLRQRHRLPAGS